MQVKTIKPHENDYGTRDGLPYEKSTGRLYEVADEVAAQALIDAGWVEAASTKSDKAS